MKATRRRTRLGVAGAIRTAAGPELEQYCRRYSPIALGEAVVTPGFALPNPYIIHARAASYINDDRPERYLANVHRDVKRQSDAFEIGDFVLFHQRRSHHTKHESDRDLSAGELALLQGFKRLQGHQAG
jgi:hypothetical protein